MRRELALCAYLSVSALALSAHADHVAGTRSEKLYETGHEIKLTLDRGWAELVVRRTVQNDGAKHDQAIFSIDVPSGSVATGLRTLGTLKGRPHWFAGELMEAEAAAKKYRELTGIGGYYPKDPALLSWRTPELLALQVFPVAPDDKKTIEYTLLLPTVYREGAYRVSLPGLGTEKLAASIELFRRKRGDSLRVEGAPVRSGHEIKTAIGEKAEIALVPKTSEPVSGELAVAQAADRRFVTRFGIEVAPRVSTAPKGAYVVVAIDASRSMTSSEAEAMKHAAAAYLSHLPDAKVELVTFDRRAHRRYGKFVDASRARLDLSAWNVSQKNGSAVEVALEEAEKLLAKAPSGRARRIVLMTDARGRSSLKPALVKAAVGASGAIVHIGVLHRSWPRLDRDDDHPWADAARKSGGLVWSAAATEASDARDAQRDVYEEWARPLRIDHLALFSSDFPLGAEGEAPPNTLPEGEGYSRSFIAERATSWLRVEGELWSKPVERVLHVDPAASKRWAALTFGNELRESLSEPEMMKLALMGGAVSPVTSYLAIEPGVRPSTEGLDWEGGGGTGFGSGLGRLRMGATTVSSGTRPLDREKWLRNEIGAGWRACGGSGAAGVTLETTKAEVVDVTRTSIETPDPVLERCLAEAVWDLALPSEFSEDWNSWSIDV
jgi:hypothetical protein